MKRRAIMYALSAVVFTATASLAQTTPQNADGEADRTKIDYVVLREGTEVPLRFAQNLTSKQAISGDSVELILAQDLIVDGVTVVRAGAHASAEVSNAKKAGMMGKGGQLNIRLDRLQAGGGRVRIRGNKSREGDDKVGAAVALTVLFGPVGLLKHGKNIEIADGTPLVGYVAEDIKLPPVH